MIDVPRGAQLSHVSARVLPMTSSPPAPAPVSPAPGAVPSPSGGLGSNFRPDGSIAWFLANCDACNGSETFAEPFRHADERDAWAIAHLLGTGHVVSVTTDGTRWAEHLTAYLRRTEDGAGFRWLCPAADCVRWVGAYDTPQLALAAWRSHPIEATR